MQRSISAGVQNQSGGTMFIVTFHGSGGGIDQLYSYNDDGTGGTAYLAQATPSGTNGFRDLQFLPFGSGGLFYLVNSYKESSDVFQIAPSATTVPQPFVSGNGGSGSAVGSVYHPFGLAFDSALEVLYISNQDSNAVVRTYGPNIQIPGAVPGEAMPVNPALPQQETFLEATFVASQIPLAPPGCPVPMAVSGNDGGLAASPTGLKPYQTPSNSVRGITVIGTTLYVADEVDNLIRQYDTGTGAYLGPIADPKNLVSSLLYA
jgi:hypothetical protein